MICCNNSACFSFGVTADTEGAEYCSRCGERLSGFYCQILDSNNRTVRNIFASEQDLQMSLLLIDRENGQRADVKMLGCSFSACVDWLSFEESRNPKNTLLRFHGEFLPRDGEQRVHTAVIAAKDKDGRVIAKTELRVYPSPRFRVSAADSLRCFMRNDGKVTLQLHYELPSAAKIAACEVKADTVGYAAGWYDKEYIEKLSAYGISVERNFDSAASLKAGAGSSPENGSAAAADNSPANNENAVRADDIFNFGDSSDTVSASSAALSRQNILSEFGVCDSDDVSNPFDLFNSGAGSGTVPAASADAGRQGSVSEASDPQNSLDLFSSAASADTARTAVPSGLLANQLQAHSGSGRRKDERAFAKTGKARAAGNADGLNSLKVSSEQQIITSEFKVSELKETEAVFTVRVSFVMAVGCDERQVKYEQEERLTAKLLPAPKFALTGVDSTGFYKSIPQIIQGDEKLSFDLNVSNKGHINSHLVIKSISLACERAGNNERDRRTLENLRSALADCNENLAVKVASDGIIAGSSSRLFPVVLSFDAKHILKAGGYEITLRFAAEVPDQDNNWQVIEKEYTYTGRLSVNAIIVNPGTLAVDFGTSASCAAFTAQTGNHTVFAVEENQQAEDKNNLLSWMEITDSDLDNEANYKLGYSAYINEMTRENIIKTPKRNIIPGYQFTVPCGADTLEVGIDLVVRKFYERLIKKAFQGLRNDRGLNPEGNCFGIDVKDLVITYPSRFNSEQVKLLQTEAERAFSEVTPYQNQEDKAAQSDADAELLVKMVPEPIAAAFSYIASTETAAEWHRKNNSDSISYTLLVFDCGGGTTDLCCLKIASQRQLLDTANNRVPFYKMQRQDQQRTAKLAIRNLLLQQQKTSDDIVTADNIINNEINRRNTFWLIDSIDEINETLTVGLTEDSIVEWVDSNFAGDDARYTVTINILNSSGNPLFGGSDITGIIRGYIERFVDRYVNNDKKGKVITADIDIYRQYFNNNLRYLEYIAELIKCAFHSLLDPDESTAAIERISESSHDGKYWYIKQNQLMYFDAADIQKILGLIFKDRDKAKTRIYNVILGQINNIALLGQKLAKMAGFADADGSVSPDAVLISGRASRWPQFGEIIRSMFPNADYPAIFELKHCVALGASRMHALQQRTLPDNYPGIELHVVTDEYTTTSVGFISGQDYYEVITAGKMTHGQDTAEGDKISIPISSGSLTFELCGCDVPAVDRGRLAITGLRDYLHTLCQCRFDISEFQPGSCGEFYLTLGKIRNDPAHLRLTAHLDLAGQTYEGKLFNENTAHNSLAAGGQALIIETILNKAD